MHHSERYCNDNRSISFDIFVPEGILGMVFIVVWYGISKSFYSMFLLPWFRYIRPISLSREMYLISLPAEVLQNIVKNISKFCIYILIMSCSSSALFASALLPASYDLGG
jgi:hypothetical protein